MKMAFKGLRVLAAGCALLAAGCNEDPAPEGEAGATASASGKTMTAKAFVDELVKVGTPCDTAQAEYSTAASADGATVEKVAAAATAGAQTCETAVRAIEAIDVPAAMQPARGLCAEGYKQKVALMTFAANATYEADTEIAQMQTMANGINAKLEECTASLKKLQG